MKIDLLSGRRKHASFSIHFQCPTNVSVLLLRRKRDQRADILHFVMGANGSKVSSRQREEQSEMLMEQNAAIAKRLSDAQRVDGNRNGRILGDKGKHLFANLKGPQGPVLFGAGPKSTIEIEGVTYDLLESIGKGGFGEVYKAKMRSKGYIVAIKVMKNSPNVKKEVEDEIHFLNLMKKISIKTLPIIKYFGAKMTNETIHMAMELAGCDLLKFWIDDVASAEPERKFLLGLTVIVYVLRALTFLEKLEIIHGDIKPQNIVIVPRDDRFCIKLIDFGTLEKMDPSRAHLTVDADKPHTLFFASPEFIKRDSRNVMSRRLHKKSDAWAAGVMFYFFFFERLPWRDQFEFDAFCNDPNARDIVVPRHGGFKQIIELLLKKNPDERASSKATLLQIKDHPQLSTLIGSMHENFCPVYDVCRLTISDDVRNDLAKLARPGHFARVSRRTSSEQRERCRYGEKCYRFDEAHREDFAHPGDRDYGRSSSTTNGFHEKQKCRYGADCFRLDTEHRRKYLHPGDSPRGRSATREQCRYNHECYNFDSDHRTRYSHSSRDRHSALNRKESCWFGSNCTDKSFEHRKRFVHSVDSADETLKSACRYGSECYDHDPNHRAQFSHPKTQCHFGRNCTKRNDSTHNAKFFH